MIRPARRLAATGRFKATLARAAHSARRISATTVDSIGREDNW